MKDMGNWEKGDIRRWRAEIRERFANQLNQKQNSSEEEET